MKAIRAFSNAINEHVQHRMGSDRGYHHGSTLLSHQLPNTIICTRKSEFYYILEIKAESTENILVKNKPLSL